MSRSLHFLGLFCADAATDFISSFVYAVEVSPDENTRPESSALARLNVDGGLWGVQQLEYKNRYWRGRDR
jgi:hypothetical protein